MFVMLSGSLSHSMMWPHVADGEDGLQIWEVDENIFKEQPQAADNKRYSKLWVGQGVKHLAIKIHTLQNITQNLTFRQITNMKFISVLLKK